MDKIITFYGLAILTIKWLSAVCVPTLTGYFSGLTWTRIIFTLLEHPNPPFSSKKYVICNDFIITHYSRLFAWQHEYQRKIELSRCSLLLFPVGVESCLCVSIKFNITDHYFIITVAVLLHIVFSSKCSLLKIYNGELP